MGNKKTFIKELGKPAVCKDEPDLFSWNKNVVPAQKPDSMNMHRRSTMQTKAPKGNSNISAEHAMVRAKRK